MRPFSGDDLIQGNTGTASLVSSATATLPGGTAEGNAGIIAMFAQTIIDSPEQWDIVASSSPGLLAVMCRADLPAGESSWPFSSAGNPNWAWTTAEWANVASAPLESSASNAGASGATSISTGTTGTFSTQYVMGIAVFGLVATAGSAWPSVSYDNSFTETDSLTVGTGTASLDIMFKVARRYGTDSETGPWSCTATFTGDMTSKTPYAALAVFRAEETADPPLPVLAG
jgi:hypothetical protein